MGKSHCSTLGVLPCWSTLFSMFNVSTIRRRKLEFGEHLHVIVISLTRHETGR